METQSRPSQLDQGNRVRFFITNRDERGVGVTRIFQYI